MKWSLEVFQIVGRLILGDIDQFEKDIEKTRKKGNNLASSIGKGFAKAAKAVGTATVAAVGAASTAIGAITKSAIESYAEYEQLAGGMEKIFSEMDTTKILKDANEAYRTLGMSANDYLAIINDVGASFASTMGDEAGYEAAKKGLTAISDYASGTGKNFDELKQKLALITRSTSSYQSIADQFSGVLPATSEGFLKQAQAAGILSKKYRDLTKVPIDEYQKAVTEMLAAGVDSLNLTGNTAAEAATTLSGSISSMKSAWRNLVTGIADENANLEDLINNFVGTLVGNESGGGVINNILPKIGQALNGIGTLVETTVPIIVAKVPEIIQEWLPKLLDSGASMIRTLMDGMKNNRESIASGASETITKIADSIIELLPEILSTGVLLIGELMAGLAEGLPGVLTQIPELVRDIADAFAENKDTYIEIGKTIVDGIWEGVKSFWSSFERNFSSLAAGLEAGFNYMGSGGSVPGLAVGLDYVPYDEFPAMLHKGEAVLTATEAAAWRAGKKSNEGTVPATTQQTSSQSGITIVQNIQAVPQTPVEFAAATEAYFEQARWSMA